MSVREKMVKKLGAEFEQVMAQPEPLVDTLSKLYTPEQLIELGTALVLEGTETLRERKH